jgi:hypothetical protein
MKTVSGDGYKNFGKDFGEKEFVCALKCRKRFNIQTGTVGGFLLFSEK